MDELKSRLEEKYGSFDPYGGYKMFISFVVTCIPEKYRKDEIEFNLELFKKSFLRCEEGELGSEEVLDKKNGGEVKNKTVTIRCGDYISIFWKFQDPKGILKRGIKEINKYSLRYRDWIYFLLTKYGVWDSRYSLEELIDYCDVCEENLENLSVEEVLKRMHEKDLCGRYSSIRKYMEENLYRVNPKRLLAAFDEGDLYDMFYEEFGEKEDLVDGDNGSILVFKK